MRKGRGYQIDVTRGGGGTASIGCSAGSGELRRDGPMLLSQKETKLTVLIKDESKLGLMLLPPKALDSKRVWFP